MGDSIWRLVAVGSFSLFVLVSACRAPPHEHVAAPGESAQLACDANAVGASDVESALNSEAQAFPYFESTAEYLSELRRTSQPVLLSVGELNDIIRASKIVFIPEIHNDPRSAANIRATCSLVMRVISGTARRRFVGLEALYAEWTSYDADRIEECVRSAFATGLGIPESSIYGWLVRFSRDSGARLLALNDARFRTSQYDTAFWDRDEWLSARDSMLLEARDDWVVEQLRAIEDVGIVVYGRAHVLSGRYARRVPGSIVLTAWDPVLWQAASANAQVAAQPADRQFVVKMSSWLFLVNIPGLSAGAHE